MRDEDRTNRTRRKIDTMMDGKIINIDEYDERPRYEMIRVNELYIYVTNPSIHPSVHALHTYIHSILYSIETN